MGLSFDSEKYTAVVVPVVVEEAGVELASVATFAPVPSLSAPMPLAVIVAAAFVVAFAAPIVPFWLRALS